MSFVIEDDEKEVLFWTIFAEVRKRTETEYHSVLSHLSPLFVDVDEESRNNTKKLRKVLERLTISLNFEKKLTTEEWIMAGMGKFIPKEKIEEMAKKIEEFKEMVEGECKTH